MCTHGERLSGGDRRLHCRKAEHPLLDRREANLQRVAERTTLRCRGVHHEHRLARANDVDDLRLAAARPTDRLRDRRVDPNVGKGAARSGRSD